MRADIRETENIIQMARAAQHDDRLADGALYGKLADKLEQMADVLRLADTYLSSLIGEQTDISMRRDMVRVVERIDKAMEGIYVSRSSLTRHKLPEWEDVRSMAPDATGELSSEAFIRELRDGW
jgi:hypothetical protein